MNAQECTRYAIHVPRVLNDGSPVPEAAHEHVRTFLRQTYGGCSWHEADGSWDSYHGTGHYTEPLVVYFVDVPVVGGSSAPLLLLARWVAAELEQEAVYVTETPIRTRLVETTA